MQTFYNNFRDYDPQLERSIESDPLGLNAGSMSTYRRNKCYKREADPGSYPGYNGVNGPQGR